jgi:SAM-dependent methyltransferase
MAARSLRLARRIVPPACSDPELEAAAVHVASGPVFEMSAPFADHFSRQAQQYAAARPHYPPALFAWIAEQCSHRRLAWDAGCGNGQASAGLAIHFDRVIATDPSAAQIAAARPFDRVEFRVEAAESPTLEQGSADLVLVAQALHWFDQERFHAAVRRTLHPAGCFVALCYGLLRIEEGVDRVIASLYHEVLAAYWPPERDHVDRQYRDLPFPYEHIEAPMFEMSHDWSLADVLSYLSTWSAVQRHLQATGIDPLTTLALEMRSAWGDPDAKRRVRWPLTTQVGRLRN